MLKFKKMGSDKVPVLLITANVGSIFEDPSVLLPIWTTEFLQTISKMDVKFIALHMQEVGGKTYERSMQYVENFVDRLCSSEELKSFDKVRIFLDEDFSTVEKFTALGNIYFAHSSLTDLKIWDFELKDYVNVEGKQIHTGNIEKVTTKEKAKFPQHFFPECKWSRKGFLRTRWHIRGTSIEFINIHLFHDASNLVATEGFPSVYSRSRRRALRHTLRHLHSDKFAAPYFIFGDFNFRTDTAGVLQKLTEDLMTCRVQNNGKSVDSTKLQYKDPETERLMLTIGKKEFSHAEHQKIFREPWLLKYDRELESLRPHLYEFPIKFPPSYPYEENVELPTHFMKTRCPAWCDRVLLSQTARLLVQSQTDFQKMADNKHLHASRKSMIESDSSGRASSSESSPARPGSASHSPIKKQDSRNEFEGLCVPNIAVSRKSIADPTSLQQAINSGRMNEVEGSSNRRKLVRNQSEGSPKVEAILAGSELRKTQKRVDYGIIGETTCMGDHKPIYLRVYLQADRGTSQYKSTISLNKQKLSRTKTDPDILNPTKKLKHRSKTSLSIADLIENEMYFFNSPSIDSLDECHLSIPEVEITSATYRSNYSLVPDINTHLLHTYTNMGPYTPESAESHSPNVESISNNDLDYLTDCLNECENDRMKLKGDRSISPSELKIRLDKLLNNETRLRKSYVSAKSAELELLNPKPCTRRRSSNVFRSCWKRCTDECSGRSCTNTGCNQCCRFSISDCCTS